jgi:hypothetical protein
MGIPSLALFQGSVCAATDLRCPVQLISATSEPERVQWIANLDEVAALEPAFVAAGHKKTQNGNDPKIMLPPECSTPGTLGVCGVLGCVGSGVLFLSLSLFS